MVPKPSIVDTYHRRLHPETGQTPATRWAAGGWLPRMPDSAEALDLLLLTVATPRKVQRDGIRCHGLRYFSLTSWVKRSPSGTTHEISPRSASFTTAPSCVRAVSPDIAAASISARRAASASGTRPPVVHNAPAVD